MSEQRVAMIRERLTAALSPLRLEIVDDSHHHVGHASAGGAGHFTVRITTPAFVGKSPIQRHRMVYDAVGDLMPTEVHALGISATTPDEVNEEDI